MDAQGATKGFDCLCFFIIIISTVDSVCDEGWSGTQCDMQCHCALNPSCQDNGRCATNEPCDDGFFGPGCQYVNLLVEEGASSNPGFLKDNDDDTCNPDTDASAVTIGLRQETSFSWLRLIVNDVNLQLRELQLNLNGLPNGCPSKKWSKVEKVVDIFCNGTIKAHNVTFEQPLASHLCSVYLSGGRNLASKQSVTLSSTASEGDASFSVDGQTTNSSGFALCSHTDVSAQPGVWRLTLHNEALIAKVRIFTLPEFMHTLAGVAVRIHGSNMTALQTYSAPNSVVNNTLVIDFTSRSPVKYLSITGVNVNGVTDGRLSVCEVEAFGESVCPNGKYGFTCDNQCTCTAYEVCHPVTGGCLLGCPHGLHGKQCKDVCPPDCMDSSCSAGTGACYGCQHGWYGTVCENRCPANCLDGACNAETGVCNVCALGYQGHNCSNICPKLMFGINCSQMCSARCAGYECNYVTGICDRCPTGRGGPACEECPHGTFGNNCTGKCPVNCNGSTCDRISGTCYSCSPNYQGTTCSQCASGKYGVNCSHMCSEKCLKRICDEVTGVCIKCAPGFQGNTCDSSKVTHEGSQLLWVFLVFGILPVTLGIVAYCKHARQKSAEQGQSRASGSSGGD